MLPWLEKGIREPYKANACNQYLIFGNVLDQFPFQAEKFCSLKEVILEHIPQMEIVVYYSPRAGIEVLRWVGEGHSNFKLIPQPSKDWADADPFVAIKTLDRLVLSLNNLYAAAGRPMTSIAIILDNIDAWLPQEMQPSLERVSMALTVRSWASQPALRAYPLVSFLVSENVGNLNATLFKNPRMQRVEVPYPDKDILRQAIPILETKFRAKVDQTAILQLEGLPLVAVEEAIALAKDKSSIPSTDIRRLKKALLEREGGDMLEFLPAELNLDAWDGNDKVKNSIRRDLKNWNEGRINLVPTGYLLVGPVGTGKTFLVSCLGGEGSIPVIEIKNFRDKYVGNTEGNLDKIFRLAKALKRCIIFIDEADQAIGKRNVEGDSGLAGRIYAAFATQMGNPDNRGKILWILASSKPNLIEVDIKRPGRIDFKIPLFPTTDVASSWKMLCYFLKKFNIADIPEMPPVGVEVPLWITPGAARAFALELCTDMADNVNLGTVEAIKQLLARYEAPVSKADMEAQIINTVREVRRKDWIPETLHKYLE